MSKISMRNVNWLEMHETIVYMKELGYKLHQCQDCVEQFKIRRYDSLISAKSHVRRQHNVLRGDEIPHIKLVEVEE